MNQKTNKHRSKSEMVYEKLLERIQSNELKPGDKLPSESVLMQEYEVSRVTLRESMKRLKAMGLVDIIQGDGTYVREVSPSDFIESVLPMIEYNESNIDEIYDARIYCEGGACSLAAGKCTEEDLEYLEELVENMRDAIALNDYLSYSRYDRRFHTEIIRISGNRILTLVSRLFHDVVDHYVRDINTSEKAVERSMMDHDMIIQAILDGDGEYARIIMEHHLERSRNILLDYLKKKAAEAQN